MQEAKDSPATDLQFRANEAGIAGTYTTFL